MPRESKIITISLPPDLAEEIDRLATAENRSRSEVVREAFRDYVTYGRWRRIRRWGDETAREFGIRTEADVDRILHEDK
ncbi:MAG: ribbon-helix-helix domain-containing protein [Thermoleophilia bacterium]|nr:ribbon-helix-helix domain-containing protein [Thermoleophilia bacterium]